MTNHTPLLRSAALGIGLGLLGLSGCDVTDPLQDVELHVDLSDAPVDIPASVGTLTIQAGQAAVNTGTVTNDTDIDRIETLRSITVLPSYLTFTPVAAAAAGGADIAAQTGTIEVLVTVNGYPIPPDQPLVITIEDDVVTAITPLSIEFAGVTYNPESIQDFLDSLAGVEVPLIEGWETLTLDQVISEIETALASSSFTISIAVTPTGDLDGTLVLSQLSFDAEAVLSQ